VRDAQRNRCGEHRGRWLSVLLAAALAALAWPPIGALAQQTEIGLPEEVKQLPVLLSADEIVYDQDLGIVTAAGHVELAQDERVLLADSVSYNLRTKVVTASGNVSLLDGDGNAYFAEYVELSEDLREGFIRDIGVLLSDQSRIAAASGERRDGRITEFFKAVFSPCQLCREDPTRAPLWQIKAEKIVHDQEERKIRYQNAWMEFFGIPVFYTPYLEHPDPTVDRQSGFLTPTIGTSTVLGTTAQVPYYWNIAPDKDATFSPIATTKQGVVLAGQYRQLFSDGRINLEGSATIADRSDGKENHDDEFRGHIDVDGRFEINEVWRWGFDIDRASDDTYLRLYDFSDARTLTSNVFAERLSGRNYASINAFAYQGLRDVDITDELPIVAPLLDYNYISEPDSWGGRHSFDANLAALTRIDGRDVQRLSLNGGWERPFIGPWGDLFKIMANLQADAYLVQDYDPNSDVVNPSGPTESDLVGRFLPQLAVQWRYPWVRPSSWATQVVEPIAQVVLAPNTANNDDIPNEDSLDFEFDDTNLFSLNRFPGVDRVDPGSRVDYGLKWTALTSDFGQASAFVGQSFRFEQDDAFEVGSGLEDNLSDVVGRVRLQPRPDIDVSYRFRIDKDSLAVERNELGLNVGPPALRLKLGYTFVDSEAGTADFEDREELVVRAESQLNENWSTFARHKRDLERGSSLSSSVGIGYEDECFVLEVAGRRTFFRDREIEPEDSVMLRVVFKRLGQISTQ
jgi:LPS-assembly protein